MAVSVFIALITLFSSLSAFLTDSSKTTSKTYFFFEVFLSSFLSSLFFGALAAVFNSHFKARGSSLFVLGIRIFFGSLLGASSTLMMTFFTSYSLKPVVEQKKEIFANTKRGDFSLVKKPVSIYKDDFFYLTTLRSDQERNSSKHEPKQGLPEFGFNKAQIDILTKIVNTSKSSTILPRILHIINIPYQLSSIGSYINDKNVNTTFFPPDSPILFSPESSFSFKVLEAGEGDNKDL